jgi:hypothetical protein
LFRPDENIGDCNDKPKLYFQGRDNPPQIPILDYRMIAGCLVAGGAHFAA